VEIATVGQNVTTYSDILSEWGTYYYRVRAYNTLGNSSYSNEATPFLFVEGDDGGCFIATAAFGSPLERHVRMLRGFRDRYLLTNVLGKAIVGLYYEFGPPMAGIIAKNEVLRAVARVGLYPLVGSRYVALLFSHTGNIVLLLGILGILAILAGLFHRVFKAERRKISMAG